jgi:hypothetical protein
LREITDTLTTKSSQSFPKISKIQFIKKGYFVEKNAALYDLTQNTQGIVWQAAFQQYQARLSETERASQVMPLLLQLRSGYAESPGWMMIQAAEFDPEPLSVERFRKRAVYTAPNLSLAVLELLASEKWLDRKGSDYYLTDEGRKIVDRLIQRRTTPFTDFEPIPKAELQRLIDLCERVMDSAMKASEPPGTWCLAHSRNRQPKGEISLAAQYIQFGSDFNAIRDDAHMAAYGSHDVPGHVWEGFTYIATNQAKNVHDLYQCLAYRGFYTEDWQIALDDLCGRGWLAMTDGNYALTEAGQTVRDNVEQKTDAYFYAAWDFLSESEFDELTGLMQQLHDTCQNLINQ